MLLLLTTDLHLTARPEHAYRLAYLEWLVPVVKDNNVGAVVICGDLSDAKDHHPGSLVNDVVDRLSVLQDAAPIHILYGNHDGPSPDRPFWRFLGNVANDINYYTAFTTTQLGEARTLMVPWGAEKQLLEHLAHLDAGELIFMHVTANGARVENGTTMTSSFPSVFLKKHVQTRVFSGDIHVPQICGQIEYIGCPYHIHYGDGYEPRTLIYNTDSGQVTTLRYKAAPQLLTVRVEGLPSNIEVKDVKEGDRLKLVVNTDTEILPQDWQRFVAQARSQFDLVGIQLTSAILERHGRVASIEAPSAKRSDEAIVRTYGERRGYEPDILEAGVSLLKEG